MDKIIHFSIHHKLVVGMAVLGLLVWGLYALSHLPIDAVPDITDNQVQVITNAPVLAAQEVEQLITTPLELALSNIPRVEEMRSVSRFGLSVITIVFEERMSIYLARQLVEERLRMAEAELPAEAEQPSLGPISTGLGEIYQYVLYADEAHDSLYDAMALRSLQDWVVRRQLSGLKGVIEINSSGGYLKQYEVQADPDRLKAAGVTLGELFAALADNNANTGGSYIEKTHYAYFIRGEGMLKSLEDIRQVPIGLRQGLPVLVQDVAEVRFGHAPRFGAVTMDGRGEVVAGQVMMLKGANSAEVLATVKAKIEQIRASLPEGVHLEPYLDRSELVGRTTGTVAKNLIEGGLIVVFILVLLLGNWRAGLVVASVIPLAMLFAFGMMRLFGVSANLMSLGAIDFGLIVDGAVIIVESIVHRLHQGHAGQRLSRAEMDRAVFGAAARIRSSAAFGEIIILIVYLPLLFLSGIEGKMFGPMAQTVAFAILGAFLLSLTYVPMMSALVLQRHVRPGRSVADRLMAVAARLYRPLLHLALRAKQATILLALLLFGAALALFARMGGEFIPTLEEGDFALHQILPPGSSIQQGVEVSAHLQRILLEKFPEVEKVVTKIGTAEIPTDIMPMEAGDIYVNMKPKSEWRSAHSREAMFERMEAELSQFPGVAYEFTQPIQMRFNELMTGVRQDIAIKIYGQDLGLLARLGKDAEAIIRSVPGTGDVQLERTAGLQQIMVDYHRGAIARHGLSIAEVNRVLSTAFAGATAGHIYEGDQRYALVLRLRPEQREDIAQVRQLLVPVPGGGQVPLHELADIAYREGPVQISRDDGQRRIVIGVNARGRDVESLVAAIETALQRQLDLPTGYHISYGGQFENLKKAKARLSVAVPAALFLIFMLLYFTFGSVKQALLIFTAVPLSAIGGVLALWLRGMPFSISAGVGFIALFGVAVLNGIVLIAYFNELKQQGIADLHERIRQGTMARLRPVLMTAAVASLGFLPMALSTSAGAEVQQPLATVVIGGLVSATFLTLLLLPVLYYYVEKGWAWRRSPPPAALLGLLLLLGLPPKTLDAQSRLSLGAAMQRLDEGGHPLLRPAELGLAQKQRQEGMAGQLPFATLSYSGEEVNFDGPRGIHSLNLGQNFNLPGTVQRRRQYYAAQSSLAEAERQYTRAGLRRQLHHSMADYAEQAARLRLLDAQDAEWARFERLAERLFAAGEQGKLPLLAIRQQRAALGAERASTAQDLAQAAQSFAYWLGAEGFLPEEGFDVPAFWAAPQGEAPRLALSRAEQALAEGQAAYASSQRQAQIVSGLQLQMVDGALPYFGWQVGLSAPLFGRSYRAQVEAAEIGREKALAQSAATARELEHALAQLALQWQQAREQIRRIDEDLLPLAAEQLRIAEQAFAAGESDYLPWLQASQQQAEWQRQRLAHVRQLHALKAEWHYWTGENY